MVCLVVCHLDAAAAVGLVYGGLHSSGDGIAIHNRFAVHVACGTPYRLRQTALVAQKPLFVGIKYCYKAYFGEVKPLAQQVYTHQHIVQPFAQVFHNLYPLDGIDVGVDIGGADAVAAQVVVQLFRHTLGER